MKKEWWKERWRRYLGTEVTVDYKTCIYFFVILFFYVSYLVAQGVYAASLLHMAQIIAAAYGMGYLQVLALGNFDEAECFSGREWLFTLFCSGLYTGAGYLCGWFDRNPAVTVLFFVYCVIAYFCIYLANKAKRNWDTEQLNQMLQAFQEGGTKDVECHGNEESDKKLW